MNEIEELKADLQASQAMVVGMSNQVTELTTELNELGAAMARRAVTIKDQAKTINDQGNKILQQEATIDELTKKLQQLNMQWIKEKNRKEPAIAKPKPERRSKKNQPREREMPVWML